MRSNCKPVSSKFQGLFYEKNHIFSFYLYFYFLWADKKQKPAADGGSRMRDAHFCDLEKRFRGSLGMPVKLSGSLDKGKLVISYNSGDDLENLIERLLEDE